MYDLQTKALVKFNEYRETQGSMKSTLIAPKLMKEWG